MSEDFSTAFLTPAQKMAVTAPLESRLVLAGPGTGKTRTLVHRVAYLISELRLPAESLLAVTYTNKATEEMRHRLRRMVPDDAQRLSVGTFHSFCIRVLRQHYEALNMPKHFAVTDEKGQLSVLQKVVPTLRDTNDTKRLLGQLSSWRMSEAAQRSSLTEFQEETLKKYLTELRRQALIDFDDILLLTFKLFHKHADVLKHQQAQYQSILVDEFQDTDLLQYRILKQLTGLQTPVFAVADDDQSIFAWRGANPENLRQFVADYLSSDSEPHVIKLEANYRCSGSIVTAANRMIAPSLRLFDKVPTAVNDTGGPVEVREFDTDQEEAEAIAQEIEDLVQDPGQNLTYRDLAILYRRHQIGEVLELTLLSHGIPCQVVRGASLFDLPRIQRVLALMRVQLNPKDEISLQALVKDYLDDLLFHKVEALARSCGSLRLALWKRLNASDGDHAERRQIGRVVGMLSTAKALYEMQPGLSLSEWVQALNLYLEAEVVQRVQDTASQQDLQRISDPLGIPALETAARWLERLGMRQGVLVIAATDEANELAAAFLLKPLLASAPFGVSTWRAIEANPVPKGKPMLLLALDPEAEKEVLHQHQFIAILAVTTVDSPLPKSNPPKRNLPTRLIPAGEAGPQPSMFVTLWKLGQAYQGLRSNVFLPDYTAVDIETTDLDLERCDIVELAAVRVRNGQVVAEFSELLKPSVPISPQAEAVHHISASMVATAPTFEQVAAEFRAFIGSDTLVAHNGLGFDFPIIMRRLRTAAQAAQQPAQGLENPFFDTLPMARQLYPEAKKATLESLAARFEVDPGSSHRALDDTRTLALVFERMKTDYAEAQRARNGFDTLGCLAAAMLLEMDELSAEKSPLFRLGRRQWTSENTEDLVKTLAAAAEGRDDGSGEQLQAAWHMVIQECADSQLSRDAAQETESYLRFLELLKRYDGRPLAEVIQEFVDFTRLFQQQDSWKERNAVTLMTIHAAKGLEFPFVWIAGVDQGVIPTYQAMKAEGKLRAAKVDEERRLLYVAMTRAQTKLMLSFAHQRKGMDTGPSEFLRSL